MEYLDRITRKSDISPEVTARLVVNALLAAADEIENGALVTIDMNKTRLNILPLVGYN